MFRTHVARSASCQKNDCFYAAGQSPPHHIRSAILLLLLLDSKSSLHHSGAQTPDSPLTTSTSQTEYTIHSFPVLVPCRSHLISVVCSPNDEVIGKHKWTLGGECGGGMCVSNSDRGECYSLQRHSDSDMSPVQAGARRHGNRLVADLKTS